MASSAICSTVRFLRFSIKREFYARIRLVRPGKSGLKVSRIILGCMSYGSTNWQGWVLDEKIGLEDTKAAYELGINAFDTANASCLLS
jgi:hypothetical protein